MYFDYLGPPWPRHECGVTRVNPRMDAAEVGWWGSPRPVLAPRPSAFQYKKGGLRDANPAQCPRCHRRVYCYGDALQGPILLDSVDPIPVVHECPVVDVEPVRRAPAAKESSKPDSAGIPETYAGRAIAGSARRLGGWVPPIMRSVASSESSVTDTAVLRELIKAVDLLRKLDVRETAFSRLLLGELVTKAWGQVTVHVDDVAEDTIQSYTMLVEQSLLRELGICIGEVVVFHADAVVPPGREPLWVCRELERP